MQRKYTLLMPVTALLHGSDFGMVRADLGASTDGFQGTASACAPLPLQAGVGSGHIQGLRQLL